MYFPLYISIHVVNWIVSSIVFNCIALWNTQYSTIFLFIVHKFNKASKLKLSFQVLINEVFHFIFSDCIAHAFIDIRFSRIHVCMEIRKLMYEINGRIAKNTTLATKHLVACDNTTPLPVITMSTLYDTYNVCRMYNILYNIHIIQLIGWQAYRGEQRHRKNSPT